MLLSGDDLNYLFVYFNGLLVCMCSDWCKQETDTYLFKICNSLECVKYI